MIMKKILLLIIMVLTVAASGFSDDRVFKKYPGAMRINTVYVSPIALKLGLSVDSEQMKSLKKIMKQPKSIEILSTDRYASFSILQTDCKAVVKNLGLDLILNCADDRSKINIYIGSIINDTEIQDILIESREETGSYNIVYINGIIDSTELMKMFKPKQNSGTGKKIIDLQVDSFGCPIK